MPIPLSLAPYLRGGGIVLLSASIVSLVISILCFHRARVDTYYFLRENARRAGLRWLSVSLPLVVLGLVALFLPVGPSATPPLTAAPSPTLSPTALVSPSAVPTRAPTATPRPSATPPPRPTATPSPSPTPTPFYPLPEGASVRLPGATPAGPEAQIVLRTFALGEAAGQPVSPGTTFPAGDYRVYLFFDYSGMEPGITWTYGWYREGEYMDGNTCPWGTTRADCPHVGRRAGSTYLFYRRPEGYDPGVYAVRIWIEDRLQGTLEFSVTE